MSFMGAYLQLYVLEQVLQILDLSLNNISGTIPSCLNNLTTMAQLGSSQATIVSWYSYADANYMGDISIMQLEGTYNDHASVIWKGVEQEYGNTLGLLKIIDLSSNKLSGEIPREIASLQGLITLNLIKKHVEGNIIQEIGQLKRLESLDLSTNRLSGEIPETIADLLFLSFGLVEQQFVRKNPLEHSTAEFQCYFISTESGTVWSSVE
ncbi:hypothetical protein DITRI_Ditri11bG0064800 [Diplodiscus trichospermus]